MGKLDGVLLILLYVLVSTVSSDQVYKRVWLTLVFISLLNQLESKERPLISSVLLGTPRTCIFLCNEEEGGQCT